MIVPYWSVDLLFVGSFFVCSGREELDPSAGASRDRPRRRLFPPFPLRIAFPRPDVPGFQGALFHLPRVQAPTTSSRRSHRARLADVYARHTRGRCACSSMAGSIGISTVLTYGTT
jgi:hypothetical protein